MQSEILKMLSSMQSTYDKFLNEIRSNAADTQKVLCEIGNTQTSFLKALDERQEASRLLSLEELELMKQIMK